AGGTGIYQASALFEVGEPLAPTVTPIPTPTAVTTGHQIQVDTGTPLRALFAGLAVLIALGLVATVIALTLRGRRQDRRRAVREMGLEVERLEPSATRFAPRPGGRPGTRQDTSQWDDRGRDQRFR